MARPKAKADLMDRLLDDIEASLQDLRLDDDEKRSLALELRQQAPAEERLRQLRNDAFDLARLRAGDDQQRALLKWLEHVARVIDASRSPAGTVRSQAWFSPGMDCLRAILQQMRAARRRIDICVFTLSDDRIAEEVMAAKARGVALRLITDNEKEFDAGSDIDRLRRAGVPVVVDRTPAHMHHKFAVFDGEWLLNGSYNWTRSAARATRRTSCSLTMWRWSAGSPTSSTGCGPPSSADQYQPASTRAAIRQRLSRPSSSRKSSTTRSCQVPRIGLPSRARSAGLLATVKVRRRLSAESSVLACSGTPVPSGARRSTRRSPM
jgi:hypothetical protein